VVNTNSGGAGRGEALFAKEAKDGRAGIFGFTILIKICEVHLRQTYLKTVQLYKK
jgi:hypothetical protein